MHRVVFTFGRFQPPTRGHEIIMKKILELAGPDQHYVFVSQSEGGVHNPLSYSQKIHFLNRAFPKMNIVEDRSIKVLFDILKKLENAGFDEVIMVVGEDRAESFTQAIDPYLNHSDHEKRLNYKWFDVVSVPRSLSISGTKLRSLALSHKTRDEFFQCLPSSLDYKSCMDISNAICICAKDSRNLRIESKKHQTMGQT